MASTITLKRRITSIRGTRQITKAMELVSASKLRRAQEYAQKSRDYQNLAYDLLRRLNAISEVERQPLFRKRTVKNRLYIVVTSNTGLAGAYNANTLKLLTTTLRRDQGGKVKSHVIAIGSKGAQFVRRLADVNLTAVYPPFGDQPDANDVRPLLNTVMQQYSDLSVDEVSVLYTKFKSTVVQESQSLQLLPAPAPEEENSHSLISNFEPDVETVVEQVTTRLIEAQIWQAILESLASEHAMRMLATKAATDNANDLIDDYTLALNTARQADITQQIAEISGGAEALNG
ncbi:ATP synthase F1 subunit gamma [Candidatus Saccharibacteria bacterium CG_4_10_14_0_2_um_filter_52_9]|nr:MAG: ATP synthase F1 subunit gamma [Candidatus Saccharibacteria bacterium CG_4_10_14_0_2_um_filter_52_9]